MLSHKIFHHHVIRKIIIAFGSLFKDVYIQRLEGDHLDETPVQKYLLVPLSYGPKQKFIYRIKQNPVLESGNVSIVMPRMAFVVENIVYDPDRKLQSTVYNTAAIDTEHKGKIYTPVPYDFNISLYILADNAEDATQILEQILPFFTPEFTVTVNTVPDMGIKNDVPVILNSVTSEDNFEGDFENKRMIIWTLQFTAKAYIYGPIREQGLIRRVLIDEHVGGGFPPGSPTVEITPAQIHKIGEPDPITAGPNDNYEFRLEIIEDI